MKNPIDISKEIEVLRVWFINHSDYSDENFQLLFQKSNEILSLLKIGKELGMTIGGITFYSLYEFFSQKHSKILFFQEEKPKMIISGTILSKEKLYDEVRESVIIQLVP